MRKLTNLDIYFKKAQFEDLDSIILLLRKLDLVFEEVENHLENFFVIKFNNEIVGCAGIEHYDDVGLLRSVAIDVNFQGKGLGKKLVEKIINYALEKSIIFLYLLTNTAEDFFMRFGFKTIPRTDVDSRIKQTYEYSTGCEETAVVMMMKLK